MKTSRIPIQLLAALALAAAALYANKAPVELAGVSCETPPPLHCPEANCPSSLVIEQGSAVEPKTGANSSSTIPAT